MNKGTVILICGFPGAGKTTLAKKLEAERNAIVFNADQWILKIIKSRKDTEEADRLRDIVEGLLYKTALQVASKGITVIIDNGFWGYSERKIYLETAKKLDINVELHYLDVPKEILFKRIEERNKNVPENDFEMDLSKLEEWYSMFQPPTEEEGKNYDKFVKYENV